MFSYGSDNMPPPDMHGQPLEMVKQINASLLSTEYSSRC